MSGVYIKGAETPFTCWGCELGHIVNCAQWKNNTGEIVLDKKSKRHPNCPLIPVPDHGRLIDADALAKLEVVPSDNWVFRAIEKAPTIIPTEEGE